MKRTGTMVLALLAMTAAAQAATITSDTFSIAFGKTDAAAEWTTTENAATNTATAIGDFTFSPSPTSDIFSGTGPVFVGRTLSDGGATGYSGWSDGFVLNIAGSYAGAPVDAAANPNYKISVEITNVSIYGAAYPGYGTGTLQFSETTTGHTANSSAVDLQVVYDPGGSASSIYGLGYASFYNLLAWNPDDYSVDGTSFTRTIALSPSYASIDGLIVEGKVSVSYDAVPEPITLSMLAMGAVALIRRK